MMKILKSCISIRFVFIVLFVLLYAHLAISVASEYYVVGDVATFKGGKNSIGIKFTLIELDHDRHTSAWKSEDGKFYDTRAAQYNNTESAKEILTELELSKDHKTITKENGSFFITENDQLQQVALIPIIANETIMPPFNYTTGRIGLRYYMIGDVDTFSGKKVTLDRFDNDKAIWKELDNKYYIVEISKHKEQAEYILTAIQINPTNKIIPTKKQNIGNDEQDIILPPFSLTLKGTNEVRIKNPNDFNVLVGLRYGDRGSDFEIPANGVSSVFVPNGKYEIYFVYSDKPDALFKGDNFALNDNGVEIQIVKVVGGNYGIKQVK